MAAMAFLHAVVAVLIAVQSDAHYADPRVSAFNIPPRTQGVKSHTVSVGAGKAKATCTFSFRTVPADEVNKMAQPKPTKAPEPAVAPGTKTIQSVVDGQLRDQCVTMKIDYWDYEVCVGSGVKQFHQPDSYPLGTFVGWEGDTQLYQNGAPCEARADRQPRWTRVKFACSKGHPTFLHEIRETEVCVYEAIVASPVICDFPDYPVFTGGPRAYTPQYDTQREVPVDDGSEDWFMQLSELADGRFICSIYSNEMRAAGSKLYFLKFQADLDVQNLPMPESLPKDSTHQYIARHPGRMPCHKDEMTLSYSEEHRRTTMTNSDRFTGKMAYAKVFA